MQTFEDNLSHQTFHEKPGIYGSFRLGQGEYAIEADYIQEVVNLNSHYVKMPQAKNYLMGLYNLRGAIIPIVHLNKLFQIEEESSSTPDKLAVLNYHNCKVGFLFDSTGEIIRTKNHQFLKTQFLSENAKSIIKGVIEFKNDSRMIQVLDLPVLLKNNEIPSFTSEQNQDENISNRKNKSIGTFKRCVCFSLGESKYALNVESIKEITEVGEMNNHGLNIQSETFTGMMDIRGRTIPIIDLKSILNLKDSISHQHSLSDRRIIIVDIEGSPVGLLVESLENIIPYYSSDLIQPYGLNQQHSQFIEACIPRENDKNILLFNSSELFLIKEIQEIASTLSRLFPAEEKQTSKKVLSNNVKSYLSFKAQEIFGVPIEAVREIINYKTDEVSLAPSTPRFISGLMRLRNDALYLVDLKKIFNFNTENLEDTETHKKILILEKEKIKFGFIVDEVISLTHVNQKDKVEVPFDMISQKSDIEKFVEEGVLAKASNKNESMNLIILGLDKILNYISSQLESIRDELHTKYF